MLNKEDLEAIRKRCEAAAMAVEGPWSYTGDGDHIVRGSDDIVCDDFGDGDVGTFIAHARTDVPALLDEVERLRGLKPHQPVEMVGDVARFKANPIVRYLLDSHPTVDMNELGRLPVDDSDRWQFAQLIGYSVSAGGGLSYADMVHVEEADKAVDALMKEAP